MKFFIAYTFLLLFANRANASRILIIPEPVKIEERKGSFEVTRATQVVLLTKDAAAAAIIKDFIAQFETASAIQLALTDKMPAGDRFNTIVLSIGSDTAIINSEGYILDVSTHQVKVSATTAAGLFYALQSLRQMMPVAFFAKHRAVPPIKWKIPAAHILDYPAFAYRGMQLDVSRHFFPVAFIKKYLDLLASYKINTFHWHLTDSHGWRLEIKQYPALTSTGAWRADRTGIPMTIAAPTQPGEPATYGGFYTQEQVKELVEYAKQRFITIIPEIEMPGHCTAALAAYPQFNDLDNETPLLRPCGYPGDLKHNMCVGYDSTYVFLNNILTEVISLFPSEYVHIGGDEVRGEPWLNCSRCRRLMKQERFETARQLQVYFTRRIDSFLSAKGKRSMGWEEMLWADVSHKSAGMAWHGNEGAIEAIKKGYDVVMTPYRYTYFDFYQSQPALEDNISYAGLFLDSVYAFDPQPPGLTAEELKHVLGGQACLWTENVETPERVEYMTLPRLLALAERLWSPASAKDYTRFIDKTEAQFRRFDVEHINYAKSMYNVGIVPTFDTTSKVVHVTLSDQVAGKYRIHYTMDGTIPNAKSPVYNAPLVINRTTTLKTCLVTANRIMGKVNSDVYTMSLATGKPIRVSSQRIAEGNVNLFNRLSDGIHGSIEPYDNRWVSFADSVVMIDIDLETTRSIKSISMGCMEDQVGNIYLPKSTRFSISSDGNTYEDVFFTSDKKTPQQLLRNTKTYSKAGMDKKARYIRIALQNARPSGEPTKDMILLDEVVIQ